jgi:3',5'-cyclic AMP phosphodiesterase CpdA
MRVVAISDTHMMHKRITIPKGDVLIHAGDFSGHGTASELWAFVEWLVGLPHKHKLFIAGNHDRYLEGMPAAGVNDMIKKLHGSDTGVTYLFDTSIIINGKKFFGAPWQPTFCNWAFQAPRGKAMANKWKWIPHDTDVLITHGPAYGHGDFVPRNNRVAGCVELLKKIIDIKPTLHICGHIHEGYGYTRSDESKITRFYNASICDGQYRPVNKAHRIEL